MNNQFLIVLTNLIDICLSKKSSNFQKLVHITKETNGRQMLLAKKYAQNWLRFVKKNKNSRESLKKNESIFIQNKEVKANQINQKEKEIFDWFQQKFLNSSGILALDSRNKMNQDKNIMLKNVEIQKDEIKGSIKVKETLRNKDYFLDSNDQKVNKFNRNENELKRLEEKRYLGEMLEEKIHKINDLTSSLKEMETTINCRIDNNSYLRTKKMKNEYKEEIIVLKNEIKLILLKLQEIK